MDTEDRKKLNRALELSEENNKMLKSLVRNMRWGRLFKILYWAVIIAVSLGAFYYSQPYLDKAESLLTSFSETVSAVNHNLSK